MPTRVRAPALSARLPTIIEKLKWIYDPAPEPYIRDKGKLGEYLKVAAEIHARETELQIKLLQLENERIQTLVKYY